MNDEYEGWEINVKDEYKEWMMNMKDEYEGWEINMKDEYKEWMMNMKDEWVNEWMMLKRSLEFPKWTVNLTAVENRGKLKKINLILTPCISIYSSSMKPL